MKTKSRRTYAPVLMTAAKLFPAGIVASAYAMRSAFSSMGRSSGCGLFMCWRNASRKRSFSIQYALAEITAQHHQALQIGDTFDVFRDRHAETVGKIDSGLTDRGIGDVRRAILDERAVELDLRERKIAKAGDDE